MSFAARAERFVAERRFRAVQGCESEVSEESEEKGAVPGLSSHTSLISHGTDATQRRPGPAVPPEREREISEEGEERPGVWWHDPWLRPLPPDADGFDRGMHASMAPILHFPPRGCVAPVACSRLGECDRRRDGKPCGVPG